MDKVFYVGFVNYYCEVVTQNRYYPAEIAVVRFSLRNGVDINDIYHIIFNSGKNKIYFNFIFISTKKPRAYFTSVY